MPGECSKKAVGSSPFSVCGWMARSHLTPSAQKIISFALTTVARVANSLMQSYKNTLYNQLPLRRDGLMARADIQGFGSTRLVSTLEKMLGTV